MYQESLSGNEVKAWILVLKEIMQESTQEETSRRWHSKLTGLDLKTTRPILQLHVSKFGTSMAL